MLKAEVKAVSGRETGFDITLTCVIESRSERNILWERENRLNISLLDLGSIIAEAAGESAPIFYSGATDPEPTQANRYLGDCVRQLNMILESYTTVLRSVTIRSLFGLSANVSSIQIPDDKPMFTVLSSFFDESPPFEAIASPDDLEELKTRLGLKISPGFNAIRSEVQQWLSVVVLGFPADPDVMYFLENGRVWERKTSFRSTRVKTVTVVKNRATTKEKLDSTWSVVSTLSDERAIVRKYFVNFLELAHALDVKTFPVSLQEWMNDIYGSSPVLLEFCSTPGEPAAGDINPNIIKCFSRSSTLFGVVACVAEGLGIALPFPFKAVSAVFGIVSKILKSFSNVCGAPKRILDVQWRAHTLMRLFEKVEHTHGDWMCKANIEKLIDDIIREAWKWSQKGWVRRMWDGTAWLDNLNKTFERLESSLIAEVCVVNTITMANKFDDLEIMIREERKAPMRKSLTAPHLCVPARSLRVRLLPFEDENRFQSIVGLDGLGKTTEAIQFVNLSSTAREFPDGVVWIGDLDLSGGRDCEKQFVGGVCDCLGLGYDSRYGYKHLEAEIQSSGCCKSPKILIVIDNVLEFSWIENLFDILESVSGFGNFCLLITASKDLGYQTRRHDICAHPLPPIDPAFRRHVLLFHAGASKDPVKQEEEVHINRLLEWSLGSPWILKELGLKRDSWSSLPGKEVGEEIADRHRDLLELIFSGISESLAACLMSFALLLDRFRFSKMLLADMLEVLGMEVADMDELISCGCLEKNGRVHDVWREFLLEKVGTDESQLRQRSALAAKLVLGLENVPQVLAFCDFHWIFDAVLHDFGRDLLRKHSKASLKKFQSEYHNAVRSNEACLRLYFELSKKNKDVCPTDMFCGESLWIIACAERHASLIQDCFSLWEGKQIQPSPRMVQDGFTQYCRFSCRGLHCEKDIVQLFVKAGCHLSSGELTDDFTQRVWMPALSTLNMAVFHGNLVLVEQILQDNERRGEVDPNRYYVALQCVVDEHDADMKQCLIAHGAEPLFCGDLSLFFPPNWYRAFTLRVVPAKQQQTSLLRAARLGDARFLRFLIESGEAVNLKGVLDVTTLIMASQNGHVDCVRLLLENGADANAKRDDGGTALMLASNNGHIDCVHLLLKDGAEVNATRVDGGTALMLASNNGHIDCVHLLLKDGAEVNATRDDGGTALMLASNNGHIDCVRLLLKYGAEVNATRDDGVTALMKAYQNDHIGCVRLLLEDGAEVNAKCRHGMTLLMMASNNGHIDCVRLLLKYGAEVNAKDRFATTALILASQNGHTDCVHLLLEHGADANAKRDDGGTALMLASNNGHIDCVRLLLKDGAEVNATRVDGGTALMLASNNGHIDCVRLLLMDGAEVNATRVDGGTALMLASNIGHIDCVRLLLKYGAEVNAKAENGWTALKCASQNGHEECAKLLLGYGAVKKYHFDLREIGAVMMMLGLFLFCISTMILLYYRL